MRKLNDLLQDIGISKVKLAKYLGVSRQMVYNYLTLDSIDKWPKEKKILLLQLLDINDADDKTISSINVNTDYLLGIEKRLNANIKKDENVDRNFDLTGVDKEGKVLLSEIVSLLKDRLIEGGFTNNSTVRYLYYMIQSMSNIPEIRYILAYMAKSNGFIDPDEFAFDVMTGFCYSRNPYSLFCTWYL